MAIKKAILRKKIADTIFDLMVKTTTAMVFVSTDDNAQSLKDYLDTLNSTVETLSETITKLEGVDTVSGSIKNLIKEAVDKLNNEGEEGTLAHRIKAVEGLITGINDTTSGLLAQAKTYTDTQIGSLENHASVNAFINAVKSELEGKISGAFHFKGTVDYVQNLEEKKTNASEGDVWHVKWRGTSGETPLNAEYAYTSDGKFEELGSDLDLSAYSTTTEMNTAIQTAINNEKNDTLDGSLAKRIKEVEDDVSEINDESSGIKATLTKYTDDKIAHEKDETQEDSLAKKIKDVKDTADTNKTAIDTINNETTGIKAEAKKYADGLIDNERDDTKDDTLAKRIKGLETTVSTTGRIIASHDTPEDLGPTDLWIYLIEDDEESPSAPPTEQEEEEK